LFILYLYRFTSQKKHWKNGHKQECAAAKMKSRTIPKKKKKTYSEKLISALKVLEVSMKTAPSGGETSETLESIMVLVNASGLGFSDFMISEMTARGHDLGNIDSLKLTIKELLSTEK
tara:strand:- start:33 stop:386 length:354 start_codon:yes stop_codon:yes gene_type:complete